MSCLRTQHIVATGFEPLITVSRNGHLTCMANMLWIFFALLCPAVVCCRQAWLENSVILFCNSKLGGVVKCKSKKLSLLVKVTASWRKCQNLIYISWECFQLVYECSFMNESVGCCFEIDNKAYPAHSLAGQTTILLHSAVIAPTVCSHSSEYCVVRVFSAVRSECAVLYSQSV